MEETVSLPSKTTRFTPSPSSFTKKSSLEKPVYLCLEYFDKYPYSFRSKYRWYVLDTSRLGEGDEFTLLSETPSHNHRDSGWTIWDSIIYVFGGVPYRTPSRRHDYRSKSEVPVSQEVYFYDTTCPHVGWRRGPPMSVGRKLPYVFVHENKIYVMGGRIDGDASSWFEVFDPLLNEWKALPSPPKMGTVWSHVMLHGGTRYMLAIIKSKGNSEPFFIFDFEMRSWFACDNLWAKFYARIDAGCRQNPDLVVDNIMYYYERKVLAFDLEKGSEISVWGLDYRRGASPFLRYANEYGSPDYNHPQACLVHVGHGRICLIWDHKTFDVKHSTIRCTKFRVTRHSDGYEDILLPVIEAQTAYAICGKKEADSLECKV